MMDMNVEEMPIHHSKVGLTQEEVEIILEYMKNDIIVTYKLLELTIGIVHVPHLKNYEGKNKIQDRFDIKKETGLECLNWSDVTIGEEWNKLDYKIAEKIEKERDLYPKKVEHPFGKKFKQFFPSTVNFLTEKMKEFQDSFGKETILANKQKFKISIGSTSYTVAKGGLHSNEGPRRIIVPEGMICTDADVGSQYPRFIEKNKIYPQHLTDTIIKQFEAKIRTRIERKKLANELIQKGKNEEARSHLSVQEMLKLCLNGGNLN